MRWMLLVLLAVGASSRVAGAAGEFEYDSRKVFDLCAPDQIASTEGVTLKWGRYRQWQIMNGTASGAGSFTTTPWNTCLEKPDYTHVAWKGRGEVTFSVRGADDGEPKGRNVPGEWSAWAKLTGGQRLDMPDAIDGKQWIQLKCELAEGASVTEFSIHKKMTLPDHPRVFLTPKLVEETKKRIAASAEIKKIYDHYITNLKNRARSGWVRDNKNTWTAGQHMVSLGVAWNLSKDPLFLEEAKRQLARSESSWAKNLAHFPRPQWVGGTAACLDLVWNGLSEAERRRYVNAFLPIADKQQSAWRFSDVSNQIYTNSGKNIITGLALAGANVRPEREMFYLRQAEDLMRNHLIPGTNFWNSDDGGWGEGHGYCSFTMNDWALEAHAWASATGEDIFQKANFFKFLGQWRLYERRYNGSQFKFNDSARGSVSVPFAEHIAGRWRDRIAQKQAKAAVDKAMANPGDFSITNLWKAVVWYDPELPAAADYSYPETMPLGRHFAGVGHVVCRSGWGNEDVVAVFKSGPAFTPGTHYHADENSFVIDRGGSLAIDSGSDDRSCDHYPFYFTRTIAHNTITVKKPGEKFRAKRGNPPNDGGQMGGHWPGLIGGIYDSAQWGMHIRPPLQLDGVRAFETNEHFTYAVGDAAKAYGSGKVPEFTRQFLHIQPDVILVFDRVTSADASYQKRWLMHTVDEPDIRGRTAVVTHLKGRLFSETLLPADARVTKVGGPGKEFWSDGRNFPIKVAKKRWEPGAWRVEVFPGAARKTDCFLHYIYVTGSGTDAAPKAKLTDAADKVIVEVTDGRREYRAEFAKTGAVGGRVVVQTPDGGTAKKLAAGITPQRFDTEDIWK